MRKGKIYKKLHKWPGLIIAFILLYFSVTGIVMNHRGWVSGIDIDRDILPEDYRYQNWNNAGLKGILHIGKDSVLLYGNIGIWLTDTNYNVYSDYNQGLPQGADNRKIFDIHQTENGNLYAATLFGFYAFDENHLTWKKISLDVSIQRFVGIESIDDTLFVMNRSYLFKGKDQGLQSTLTKYEIPEPNGYRHEINLFEAIWQIHSGEIFGLPGKLFVDVLGLITFFLSLTGIIFFFFPGWIKRRRKRNKSVKSIAKTSKWSLKWHNKTGTWLFVFLIILFFTGMFLRPPLLIAIAKIKIGPIPFTHLDQPNPWYDKLRDIKYDEHRDLLMIATSEGIFHTNLQLEELSKFKVQPPVSVMGITVFEPYKKGAFLIGSFSGLFLWHPEHEEILDFARGTIHHKTPGGRPVGDFAISGFIKKQNGQQFMIDYDRGVLPLWHKNEFAQMPEIIRTKADMSLWNLCLEIHTGRFFSFLLGDFYILIVPLSGLLAIMVVLSGYLLWRKRHRKRT